MKSMSFSQDKLACLLVALTEFEIVCEEKPRAFGVYKEINEKLVETMREANWQALREAKQTPSQHKTS